MAKKIITFTQARIKELPASDSARTEYWDTEITKLCCRVSKTGNKSFSVNKWDNANQRAQRVTLGRYPDINVSTARKLALSALSDLSAGINPTAQKKKKQKEQTTLLEVLELYLANRDLKSSTVKDYRYKLKLGFEDWSDKAASSITEDMVLKRHKQTSENKGKRTASNTFRVLKLVLNYAVAINIIESNPEGILGKARMRHKDQRKDRVIPSDRLGGWLDAVESIDNEKAKVYLLMLIYMGCRSTETRTLEWSHLDLKKKNLTLYETKNGTNHTLPIPKILLPRIRQLKTQESGRWLFPNTEGTAPMSVPNKQIKIIVNKSKVEFSPHDCRRTFATIAEAVGLPLSIIKKLLNHSTDNDVTGGYIRTETHTLLDAIERIADFISEQRIIG